MNQNKPMKKILKGKVVKVKHKTITVLVERKWKHPIYKKTVISSKKYQVHDNDNIAKQNENVKIIECNPISKTKRFTLLIKEKKEK